MTETVEPTLPPDRWRPSRTTLTIARLLRAAAHLWEPAFGLACDRAGPSADEFVAAYIEGVACLAGSARWAQRDAAARITEAAAVTGVVLTAEDWRHLWRCYREAEPGLAEAYRVSTDGHHGAA